ncbi:MAG: hypothetical protein JXO22_00930 [Phycisphaerae bacterium]|nr:hypothetical protein [Phycisphaerae bacterium]
MNAETGQQTVAVIGNRSAGESAVREFLAAHRIRDVRWYDPHDLDDVERAIQDGEIRRVIIPTWSVMLDGVWGGLIDVEAWFDADVQIDFVEAPTDRDAQLVALAASWRRHRQQRRRRQIIAGAILSVIALAAAFIIIWRAG